MLHQSAGDAVFEYSQMLSAGMQHRRKVQGLKADRQNLNVAAAGLDSPSPVRQVRSGRDFEIALWAPGGVPRRLYS